MKEKAGVETACGKRRSRQKRRAKLAAKAARRSWRKIPNWLTSYNWTKGQARCSGRGFWKRPRLAALDKQDRRGAKRKTGAACCATTTELGCDGTLALANAVMAALRAEKRRQDRRSPKKTSGALLRRAGMLLRYIGNADGIRNRGQPEMAVPLWLFRRRSAGRTGSGGEFRWC